MRSMAEVEQELRAFPDTLFYQKPAPDVWCAAEIADHLHQTDRAIIRLLEAPDGPLTDRDPAGKEQEINTRFSDMGKKYQAFGTLIPSGPHPEKSSLFPRMEEDKALLIGLMESRNPFTVCTVFEHRAFGFMTRIEWILFLAEHNRRHIRQLQRLAARIKSVS